MATVLVIKDEPAGLFRLQRGGCLPSEEGRPVHEIRARAAVLPREGLALSLLAHGGDPRLGGGEGGNIGRAGGSDASVTR